jgi:adenosylcobinamide-phosphate synthase
MGDGRAEAGPDDVARALRVYRLACGIWIGAVTVVAFVTTP